MLPCPWFTERLGGWLFDPSGSKTSSSGGGVVFSTHITQEPTGKTSILQNRRNRFLLTFFPPTTASTKQCLMCLERKRTPGPTRSHMQISRAFHPAYLSVSAIGSPSTTTFGGGPTVTFSSHHPWGPQLRLNQGSLQGVSSACFSQPTVLSKIKQGCSSWTT